MKYYVTFILLAILLIPLNDAFAEIDNSDKDYVLTVSTENSKYIPGQLPVIFGTVYDKENTVATKKVLTNMALYILLETTACPFIFFISPYCSNQDCSLSY